MGKVLRKRRRVWRVDGHVRGIVVSRRRPRGRAKSRGERNPFDFACHLVERSLSTSGKTTVFPAFHRAEFTKPVDSFRLEFGRGKVKGWWTPAFTRNARRRLLVEISISIIELRGFARKEVPFLINSVESRPNSPNFSFPLSWSICISSNSRGGRREINVWIIFSRRGGE